MLLDNPLFFAFVLAVLAAFVATPGHWRWVVLLVASAAFYGSFLAIHLISALTFVTVVTYLGGRAIDQQQVRSKQRLAFLASVAAIVLVLLGAKVVPIVTPAEVSIATIGVSYYTIQAIAYLTDIYLGRYEAERSLGRIALFLGFFPKLLQGPIERGNDFLPQLRQPLVFTYESARPAALRIGFGLFKKAVVADFLGLYVGPVFARVQDYTGPVLVLATYLFAFQLYVEFSGYTDIAIGVARLFGLRLAENFRRPYEAPSVAEFWRGWHMSFTRWLLDYLFRPLQLASRRGRLAGTAAAVFVTFVLSGAWHGFQWTFLTWGALHGVYLAVGLLLKPHRTRLEMWLRLRDANWIRIFNIIVTFNLVCLAWVFFRAQSIGDAWWMVTHFSIGTDGLAGYALTNGKSTLALGILGLVALMVVRMAGTYADPLESLLAKPVLVRWSVYVALGLSIVLLGTRTRGAFMYAGF